MKIAIIIIASLAVSCLGKQETNNVNTKINTIDSIYIKIDSSHTDSILTKYEINIIYEHKGEKTIVFHDNNKSLEHEYDNYTKFKNNLIEIEVFTIWSVVGSYKSVIYDVSTNTIYETDWYNHCACGDMLIYSSINYEAKVISAMTVEDRKVYEVPIKILHTSR